MTAPYRDETETLRRENERLRIELARRRGTSGVLALGLVVLDVIALFALRPWFNGDSDLKFWLGVMTVVGIALAAMTVALGIRERS